MNRHSWNQLIASTAMTIPLWIALFAGLLVQSSPIATAQSFDTALNDTSSPLVLEGFIAPYRDIRVGSPDTATIIEMRADEGNTIRVGQVIARLDDTVAIANTNIARQATASSGELGASRLQMLASKRRYEQCIELHGRNHATDQELWNMQASLDDGIAIDRLIDIGEIVSPADPHLVRIVKLDPLRINATAPIQQSKHSSLAQVALIQSRHELANLWFALHRRCSTEEPSRHPSFCGYLC